MAKILIVDDSVTVRNQLKKLLNDRGHEVVEGSDGLNGIEVLSNNQDISLIKCDVNMPMLDGLSMLEKINEDPEFSTVPIFMLTTESNPEMKVRGKAVGVKAWITKPYNDTKLLSAVDKVLKS